MDISDYNCVLAEYEHKLGHQKFIVKFEIELPTVLANFVMSEMTECLQQIDIDDSAIEFLRFYPFVRDKIVQVVGEMTEQDIRRIFYEYSRSFVKFWSRSIQEINKLVQRFKKINLNSAFLNRMMMLFLIRELSHDCQKKIRRNLGQSRFRMMKDSGQVIKFVIERLEVFEFKPLDYCNWQQFDTVLNKRFTKQSAQERLQEIFQKPYQELQNNSCFQSENKQKQGIYVSDPLNTDQAAYLLREKGDRIIITHSKYLHGWQKFEFHFKQKDIKIQLKESFEGAGSSFITNSLTNIGSSLGYLLANMPNRPTKFLKEFFLACTISGSMTMILTSIPILGKLILIGGLGYQAADVLKNTDIQTKKKIEKIVGISLSMTVTVGSSLGGAIAGQILIPVPILGGFIGAVVGGLIGGLSTSAALNKFQQYKVKNMMINLQEAQNLDGSWELKTALNIYDLKQSFFVKHNERMDMKDLVTLFSYFVLSLFESQRQQIQISGLEDKIKKKWYRTLSEQEVNDVKQQIDRIIEEIPEVLLHTEVYMTIHDLKLVNHIDMLEKMMQQFLGVL